LKKKFTALLGFVMFITPNIDAQNSFGLAGYRAPNRQGSSFGNSFELNPSNFSLLKDW